MTEAHKPIKRDNHPLTAVLQSGMLGGKPYVPKIAVFLGHGGLRTRRPKWFAREGGWYVYDGGWMRLSEDWRFGWQTEEYARLRAAERERQAARLDVIFAKATGQ